MDFFRRLFFRGNPEFAAGPLAEVDQLAAFTAKWAVRIAREFGFFAAGRAYPLHLLRPRASALALRLQLNDFANEVVFQAIRNLDVIEGAECYLFVPSIVDQDMAVDFGSLCFHSPLKQKI